MIKQALFGSLTMMGLASLIVPLPGVADAPVHATLAARESSDAHPDQSKAKSGSGFLGGSNNGPLNVEADNGIEWQQPNKAYVARGNAVATRGDVTLRADTLTAYYRQLPNSQATEIWRVLAEGNVVVTRPDQKVTGEHGVYDIDHALIVLTGNNLKLTTPQEVVTARDSLEWYDQRQLAVARGNAVGSREDRRIRADVLAAQIEKGPAPAQHASGTKPATLVSATTTGKAGDAEQQAKGSSGTSDGGSHIKRIDGSGHVVITAVSSSGIDQVGTGDKGVYDLDTGLATLAGHVNLVRGNDSLVGEYGVMDLNSGISRLLPRPPTAPGKPHGRVQGYIIPQKDDEQTSTDPALNSEQTSEEN